MFRILLRLAVLLCLSTAAVLLIVESGEYPGVTRAGQLTAVRELLPLALIGWLNLGVLSSTAEQPSSRRAGAWLACATVANLTLLAWTLPYAKRGSPPIALALPVVGALLLLGVAGIARAHRDSARN